MVPALRGYRHHPFKTEWGLGAEQGLPRLPGSKQKLGGLSKRGFRAPGPHPHSAPRQPLDGRPLGPRRERGLGVQQGADPPQARGGCVPAGLDWSLAGPRGSEHAAQALCPEKRPCIVGRKGQRSHRPGLRGPWAPVGHQPGMQGRGAGFQGVFVPQALCGVRPWVAQSQPTCLLQAASPPGPEQVRIQGRWAGPGRPPGRRAVLEEGTPGAAASPQGTEQPRPWRPVVHTAMGPASVGGCALSWQRREDAAATDKG